MIMLKKAEAREKILKAYEAKELSAQGPTPQCFYRDVSGYRQARSVFFWMKTMLKDGWIVHFKLSSIWISFVLMMKSGSSMSKMPMINGLLDVSVALIVGASSNRNSSKF